jgi:O-methyltransferase
MSLIESPTDPPHVAADRLLQIIEARFGDGLKAARRPGARGPSPESDGLRLAYLDVLKLCLCDLGGTTTTSVARTIGGDVMSRELAGDQLRFRSAGLDWPLHGLTMVGLARLDDLQECVQNVVSDRVEGDVIETGSWRGGASMFMRAALDCLGESERTVWVADSFQGFPDVQRDAANGYDLQADLAGCDFLAVPLEEVKESFARFGLDHDVNFVPGFFEDTLPKLPARRWAIVRLDGDSYDATRLALDVLYPNLAAGGYLIVDDYLPLDECRQAVDDFRREHGITEPIENVDWSCVRWRRESEPGSLPASTSTSAPAAPAGSARAMDRPPRVRVPATEEVALAHEVSELRALLQEAQREIEQLVDHPLRGPRAWLAGQLGRRARSAG